MKVEFAEDFSIGEYHWNHRVVRRVFDADGSHKEVEYAIHEAHYEERGRSSGPCSITSDAVPVAADSIEALRWTLEQMLKALELPVLDYETRTEISA